MTEGYWATVPPDVSCHVLHDVLLGWYKVVPSAFLLRLSQISQEFHLYLS